jgi:lipopolysaccharide biosynthesis protein
MARIYRAFVEIFSRVSLTTIKSAISLLIKGGPSALFAPLIWSMQKQKKTQSHLNVSHSLVVETELSDSVIGEVKILFVVHLYYPEFVARFIRGVSKLQQPNRKFVVTSSNIQILEMVEDFRQKESIPNIFTMQVPNKGRNIAPFIQALKDYGRDSEMVIHVHSKRSEHAKDRDIESWVNSQWNLLFYNPDLVKRVVAVFVLNPKVAIAYPPAESVLSPWTYTWSNNSKKARRLLKPLGISVKSSERIAFPVGAMFAARTKDLMFLEKLNLGQENFPKEEGQIDGELHHVIERLLGYVPEKSGRLHAIYLEDSNGFTTETKALTENHKWPSSSAQHWIA